MPQARRPENGTYDLRFSGWVSASIRAMSIDPDSIIEFPKRRRASRWPAILLASIVAILILGRLALHYGAEITVKSAFYDGIGMGDVYSRRWHTNVLLGAGGVLLGLLFALPALLAWHVPRDRGGAPDRGLSATVEQWLSQRMGSGGLGGLSTVGRRRGLPLLAFVGLCALLVSSMAGRLVSQRDQLFALVNSQTFGTQDPVFHKDIGFFVFSRPAWVGLLGILVSGLIFAIISTAIAGGVRWLGLMASGKQRSAGRVAGRARSIALILVGLLVVALGGLYWLSRYALVIGGDQLVAGAGQATRSIDIPTRTVAAIVIVLVGVGIIVTAIPGVQRILARLTGRQALVVIGAVWALVAVLLTIFASPWWLVLLVPVAILLSVGLGRRAEAIPELSRPASPWTIPVAAVASAVVLAILGPAGAALNDAVVLKGTRLQVERPNIEATLKATRAATGLDGAQIVDAPYTRAAVTQEAINSAPASVGSIRFLDIPPTKEACSRLQTFNQFYTCDDVDVDRYTLGGKRRTVFGIGREIDYQKLPDFQRRHFTYTHGYGLVLAPVNEIEKDTGRPSWIAGGIPQTGVNFEGDNGSIYFGSAAGMPWSMVSTKQSVFDQLDSTKAVTWKGSTGIRVGSGWRRLAITEHLGGLPFIGGGRKVWNATSGDPADANSDLLLYRDLTARLEEIAPFMTIDGDPYFAAANGHLYVMAPVYATTDQYPYAANFGVRYLRQSTMAVMDAYSGETNLYVLDDSEPITKAWRSVYPTLFTSGDKLPAELRAHLRFGEAGLNVLAAAARRFHVTETDAFYNGDEAWAPTEEAYGPGVQGDRIVSPIRYTYAVLPGDTEERFVAVQSYKPAVQGRGIGFSGWLAVINDPDDASGTQFGRKVLLRFRGNQTEPLDSLDTFTSNVAKDEALSSEIGIRKDSVLRGNTIVVPVGKGLLYVQPLYLDSTGDSLPTLWKVIVSFGNGRVFSAPTLPKALDLALGGNGDGLTPDPGTGGASGKPQDITQLVQRASDEFDAYQKAFGSGNYEEATKRLKAFRSALARAKTLADRGGTAP